METVTESRILGGLCDEWEVTTSDERVFCADKEASIYITYDEWGYGVVAIIAWTDEAAEQYGFSREYNITWDECSRTYYFKDSDVYLKPPYFMSDHLLVEIAHELYLTIEQTLETINSALFVKGIPPYPVIESPLADLLGFDVVVKN